MYTFQQRLAYAKRLQRLQQAVVIKDNIHLTYKYKNRNKAYANIESVQDRINKSIIEDAVNGNAESIKGLEKQGEKLIHDTLTNERKRLHQDKKHKAVNHATKSNSQYFTNIFNYRREKIGESLEDKIEKELKKNKYVDLSDKDKIQELNNELGDYGKKRLKNIITDAMHTNESNIGFIKAIEEGYNYKIWKNGRVAKGRTRAWHKEKHIQAVPIDETFDIYGSYPAHMMYPGDLNGGAENVANCRCWLNYTNRIPSNLRKNTVFNVSPTFQQIWEKARKPASSLKTTIKKPIDELGNVASRISKKPKLTNNQKITKKSENKLKTIIKKPIKKIITGLNGRGVSQNYKISNNVQRQNSENHINPNNLKFNEGLILKKLKEGLPPIFSEKAATYLTNVLKRHWDAKVEHGQIFNPKTGKPTSIEFTENDHKGVIIEPSSLLKDFDDMSPEELDQYSKYPESFMLITRNMRGGPFAMQHHHTRYGLYAPSGRDFHSLMSQTWTDYSVILSQKEVWVIETEGTFSINVRKNICEELNGRATV